MTLEERVKLGEGFREKIYKDSLGNPTGGWGHHFAVGSKLPISVWEAIFLHDLMMATADYDKLPVMVRAQVNDVRREVLIEMIFNMGLPVVLTFKKTLACIAAGDFQGAHDRMLDSLWARQVGNRADRLAELMLTGVRD